MFTKVLIANRGEVALRIHSTLSKLGIETVGVHTQHDKHALHVQQIPHNYLLTSSTLSGYLDGAQIIEVARRSGAEAIHPGYGFLAERADFARQCAEAGLVFIGPSADAIAAMGEKISARSYAKKAGVPVVAGTGESNTSNEELLDACRDFAFPLLVKPSAGGGGKGLHVAHDLAELREVLPVARREALTSFGDDTLLVEKYLPRARHIEFQIMADRHGNTIHLGERECSLQRRHQKIIEEAPAPNFADSTRAAMGAAAVALSEAIGYTNLGTIEFLVDADSPDSFYFMEMNTRLQVEHRVTEQVTGLDLVECQIRLAAGEMLGDVVPRVHTTGHAIEARIYAEDPYNEFLPTGGFVGVFKPAALPHTLIDTAISDHVMISSSFDPMLAKATSWGEDRQIALTELETALRHSALLGVTTNLDFLIYLLNRTEVQHASYHTKYVESLDVTKPLPPSEVLSSYATLLATHDLADSWRSDGWRLHGASAATIHAYIDGARYQVPVGGQSLSDCNWYREGDDLWIHHPTFGTWKISSTAPAFRTADALGSEIVSPMPGAVVSVSAGVGDHVSVGEPLLVIEAMKMEYVVRATRQGNISVLHVQVGNSVRAGQLLAEVIEDV